jgi:phosphoglycerol transferase
MTKLEARLKSGTMIFQLPNTGYPADGAHERMAAYDNSRAYLHSTNLRWSWGAMEGRHHDWAKMTASLPMPQLLERVALAGFRGVLLDRFGYPDASNETSISGVVGSEAKFDLSGRWVYFDLGPWADKLSSTLSDSERLRRVDKALYPIQVEWRPSFSIEESDKARKWRWCGRDGVIRFENESDIERTIGVTISFQQHSNGIFPLRVENEGNVVELPLGAEPRDYHTQVELKPKSSQELKLHFEGPPLRVPGDTRELAFRVVQFQIAEE